MAERVIAHAASPKAEVHPEPAEARYGLDIEGRRTLITACLDKVIVRPASRPRTNRFDPTRISVVTLTGEVLNVKQTAELALYLQSRDRTLKLAS